MEFNSYHLRPGFRLAGVSVEAVGARIEALKQRHVTPEDIYGYVTDAEILEDARDPESPLHACFLWNDREAAQVQRLEHAGYLRQCYYVVVERPNSVPIVINPANVVVRRGKDEPHRIVSSDVAMSHEAYRVQVLRETNQQLAGLQARLRSLLGLSPEILTELTRLRQLIETEAARLAEPPPAPAPAAATLPKPRARKKAV